MIRGQIRGVPLVEVVGCAVLALLCAGVPSHAAEIGGKVDPDTDALIPLVVLDVAKFPDPVKVDERGITWNGVELAIQPVRVVDAIVVDESVSKAFVKRTLLLTVVGKIDLDEQGKPSLVNDPKQQVWCKDSANPNASVDCYRDSNGDGMLDQRARGSLPRLEPLSLNRIGPFEPIDPIKYRRMEPAELPVYDIAYLVCGAAGSQVKFARRIRKSGNVMGYAFGPCDNEARPANAADPDPEMLLDQVHIRIRTVDGVRTSQMTAGMPSGQFIGHLRTDRAVSDIAHARRYSEEHDAAQDDAPDIFIATPAAIAKDPVKAGETFFSAEIKHGITGTLRAAANKLKLFKGKPDELIPAGAPLFGVRMRNTRQSDNLDADIVWCYPAPVNGAATRAKCIARDSMNITRVLDIWERFTLSSLAIGSGAPAIEDPIIDRGPVDFGEPIVLEIAVEKVAKKQITVRTSIDRRSEPNKSVRTLRVQRANDGNGYLLIGRGILVLEPVDPDLIRITEKVPVTVGSDADVADAVALMRSLR